MSKTIFSTTTLRSNSVQNALQEDLGSIKDLMIDQETGQIIYAVLSFGGILGIGNKLFAVPWKALHLDTVNERFILNVPKETLKQAPGFDKDDWPDMANPDWGRAIHEYYAPYGESVS